MSAQKKVARSKTPKSPSFSSNQWVTGPSGRKIKIGGPTWRKLFPGDAAKKCSVLRSKTDEKQSGSKLKAAKKRSDLRSKTEEKQSGPKLFVVKKVSEKGVEYDLAAHLGVSPKLDPEGATFLPRAKGKKSASKGRPSRWLVLDLTPRELRNFKIAKTWGYGPSSLVGHEVVLPFSKKKKLWVIPDPPKVKFPYLKDPKILEQILQAMRTFQKKGYKLRHDEREFVTGFYLRGTKYIELASKSIREMIKTKPNRPINYDLFLEYLLDQSYIQLSKGKKTSKQIEETLLDLADEFIWWMLKNEPAELKAVHENYTKSLSRWLRSSEIRKFWRGFLRNPSWDRWLSFTDRVWQEL